MSEVAFPREGGQPPGAPPRDVEVERPVQAHTLSVADPEDERQHMRPDSAHVDVERPLSGRLGDLPELRRLDVRRTVWLRHGARGIHRAAHEQLLEPHTQMERP